MHGHGTAARDSSRECRIHCGVLVPAEHFRHEHFLCGHPSCLEKKFVVFPSEQELKQHNAREHSGSMSRAERRQALTIPIDVQVSAGFTFTK